MVTVTVVTIRQAAAAGWSATPLALGVAELGEFWIKVAEFAGSTR
jgi:hypothetical protein